MRQILLVTTQSLKDRKAFRHKMSNLYKVSLPHKLLHSNNSGPKQVKQCKLLPVLLAVLRIQTPCVAHLRQHAKHNEGKGVEAWGFLTAYHTQWAKSGTPF